MNYIVKFAIDIISKRNLISRRTGEFDITTDHKAEILNNDNQRLKYLIYEDVQPKLKQKIFNVEIIETVISD